MQWQVIGMKEITRWLYLSDLDHLTVREWINGLWFAVSFAMCFEFGKTLVYRICRHKDWRDDIGTRAIVALFAYFFGETLIRGWIWLLLALQSSGSPMLRHVQEDYYIAIIAAGISTWGAFCCLYVFSRNHWVWMRAAVIMILFLIAEIAILYQ
jgi:hypothetical protein